MHNHCRVYPFKYLSRMNSIVQIMLNKLNLTLQGLNPGGLDMPDRCYDVIAIVMGQPPQDVET